MSTDFYDLFFNKEIKVSLIDYLNNSSCDEMAEIDLNADRYTHLYHVEGKYFAPSFAGTFRQLYRFALNDVVHPDDRAIFQDLMNPDGLEEKLANSTTPYFRHARFRYKLQDGNYRWVDQCVIGGKEYGFAKGVYRFFIFDIQNRVSREQGNVTNDDSIVLKRKDKMTGLYEEKAFFREAYNAIRKESKKNWSILTIDIEHFRLFDDWFGRETGSLLLAKIGIILLQVEKDYGAIAGYLGQDDYVLLIPYDEKVINEIYNDIRNTIVSFGQSAGFMPAIGVALLSKPQELYDAFDHASIAGLQAKHDIKKRIYLYNSSMTEKEEEEYKTLLEFMNALQNEDIIFYLQPQCRISTGKVVGAESLTRWIKKDGTNIPPNKFIPVLEKYGFITDLDKYIWEKVASWIRGWLDKGHTPVPISVNVSQVDIYTIDVPEHFSNLVEKYHLEPNNIKIEITESAYAETSTVVRDTVQRLRRRGFMVLMDDFGSGYSSLNMLGNINIDVIKLDARFLNIETSDYKKSINILESIVNMTKIIGLPIIVEGVETKEQTDFLVGLGCRYVQGFYFYKPMPLHMFENMLLNKDMVDHNGFEFKHNEQFNIREFMDKNIYSESMLNNILGAVAFYSWHGEAVDIVRFNQQFYETVNVPDFHSRLDDIQRFVPEEDVEKLYSLLSEAMDNKLNGSRGIIRFYLSNGALSTYDMHFYYIGDQNGEHRFYGSVSNISKLANASEQMKLIARYSSDSLVFASVEDGHWKYKVVANGLGNLVKIDIGKLQQEFDDGSFFERIDPVTLKKTKAKVLQAMEEGENFTTAFSFKKDDGKLVKLMMRADYVDEKTSNVKYIFTFWPK